MTPQRLHHQRTAYRPEIDGLRALAVTAVIVNHFDRTLLPGGYLGVDIFFVISGYVITSVLARSKYPTFRDFILDFYTRRIKRLVPALVLCCVITGLIFCLFNPEPSPSLSTGIKALLGFSNIALYRQAVDYFGAAIEFNPFTHTWSLGVEEQFYLLFPSLLWVTGSGRKTRYGSSALFLWVLILSLFSLGAFIYQQNESQPAAYFLMHARFWELGFGCLVFIASGSARYSLNKAPLNLLSFGALIAISSILFVPIKYTISATIAVVITTGTLIATMSPMTIPYRLLTVAPAVYIGLISYSLYLWHWSLLVLSRWTVGVQGWYVPIQVALILIMACASYHFVEAPLRKAKWSPRQGLTIIYGLAASLAGAALLLVLTKPWFGDPLNLRLYAGTIPEMQTNYRKLRNSAIRPVSCNLFESGPIATQFSLNCGAGQDPAKPTIYLLGDSHIFQFTAVIGQYARDHGYNYRSVWGNSCLFPAAKLYGENSECHRLQRDLQVSLLARIKTGDIVFIGNALYARFSGLWDEDRGDATRARALEDLATDYSASLQSLAEKLVTRGIRVVIYLDGPQFVDFRGSELCNDQWFVPHLPAECFTGKQDFLDHRDRLFGWVHDWAKGPLRFVWDGVDENTCYDDICRATHYEDSNHFKGYYAAFLFEKFLAQHPEFASTPDGSLTTEAANSAHRDVR